MDDESEPHNSQIGSIGREIVIAILCNIGAMQLAGISRILAGGV